MAIADPASAPQVDESGALRVLVAVDEHLREFLAAQLRASGYCAFTAESTDEALAAASEQTVDLVLLDPALPGMSGFEVCRRVRAERDTGLILVSDRGTLSDRLRAFDCGADDYVVQPVEVVELERRVSAVLRRIVSGRERDGRDEIVGPSELRLRARAHQAFVGERLLDLTPKEFAVLRLLLDRRGEVLSSDELSTAIWGYETFGSRNFVEAHLSRLRSKLKAAGALDVVTTVRGVGYVVR